MRRLLCLLLVLALRLALTAAPACAIEPPGPARARPVALDDGMIERTRRSVVQVIAHGSGGGAAGSGFFVRIGGGVFVVTNHHVVEHAARPTEPGRPASASIRVRTAFGEETRALVWKHSRDHDIALLKLERVPPGSLPLEIRAQPVSAGEEVLAWGAPHGVALVPIDGSADALARNAAADNFNGKPVATIVARISIAPGNSGGPLLDRSGRVVGVVTARQETTGGVGAGLSITIAATEFAGPFQRFDPREADAPEFSGTQSAEAPPPPRPPPAPPSVPAPALERAPLPHEVVPSPGPVSDFALAEAQARGYACAQRLRLPPMTGRFGYLLRVSGYPRLLHFPAGQVRVVAANIVAPQQLVLTIAPSRDGGETFVCVMP